MAYESPLKNSRFQVPLEKSKRQKRFAPIATRRVNKAEIAECMKTSTVTDFVDKGESPKKHIDDF